MSTPSDHPELQKAEKAVTTAEVTVSKAQSVVADLEQKRELAIKRGTELADERANVALAAHTGDAKAARRLKEIHQQIAVHGSELASLDAALRAAGQKVEMAKRVAAAGQRRAQIKEQQKLSREYRELGPFLDRATDHLQRGLQALAKNAAAVGKDVRYVGTLHRVLQVALFDTVFRDAFGVPDANDRRSFSTFSGVVGQWCDAQDNNLARELAALDDKQTTERAA